MSSSAAPASAASSQSAGNLYDAALAAQVPASLRGKTLNIGTYNNYPPENFMQGNKLVGFDVDIANDVAAVLGLKFNLVGGAFSILIPGLQDGRFAGTFSSVNPTPDRLKTIDVVVFHNSLTGFVTKSGSALTINAASDLCGQTVAVVSGTNEATTLEAMSQQECASKGKPAIKVSTYPDTPTAALAVQNGRTEAFSETTIGLMQVADQSKGSLVLQPFSYNPKPAGAAFPKNSPLTDSVAAAINKLIANGAYGEIMHRWNVDQSKVTQATVQR